MSLSFREMTNSECILNRELSISMPVRDARDAQILAGLEAAKAAYRGQVKILPPCQLSDSESEEAKLRRSGRGKSKRLEG